MNKIILVMTEILWGGGAISFDRAEEIAKYIYKHGINKIKACNNAGSITTWGIKYKKWRYQISENQFHALKALSRVKKIKRYWR